MKKSLPSGEILNMKSFNDKTKFYLMTFIAFFISLATFGVLIKIFNAIIDTIMSHTPYISTPIVLIIMSTLITWKIYKDDQSGWPDLT
jgi:hypothetical protein